MRSFGYAIACGALLMGTAAQAVTLDIVGVKSGNISLGEQKAPWPNGMIADYGNDLEVGYGGSTETKVKVTPAYASFESGVAVSGPDAAAQSHSGLDADIANVLGNKAVSIGTVESTIIPAGLGFYMQDRTGDPKNGGNIFTGYGQAGYSSFADLFTEDLAGTTFATAGFTFDIYGDDYVDNPEAVALYSLSGNLTLSFDGNGKVIQGGNIQEAGLSLNGFTTAYNKPFALAYAWGETDVEVALNKVLGIGQSTSLYYRTTAYANTNTTCLDDAVTCLVAYSGFGDPIGRGGGVSLAARGLRTQLAYKPITGIVFDPQLIDPFRFSATDVGGVPEPATWISMLMGFGLLGAALRRRRVVSYS
jgi:hypothetical protein